MPFRESELALQRRAGVPEQMSARLSEYIRDFMPDEHRAFFETQQVVFVAVLDSTGRPWAFALHGVPGFVRSPDPKRLSIGAEVHLARDLSLDLRPGAGIGLVGLDLVTRRRNRVNGALTDGAGLTVAVRQSFGNCPQYIQARDLHWSALPPPRAERLTGLNAPARRLIARCDTFFLATRSRHLDGPENGPDVSHRGGLPGFLLADPSGRLSFPDFPGNRFFNTLGNIEEDGRVGLFVPDFDTGEALILTGRATCDWRPERAAMVRGAQRVVDVEPEEIWRLSGAVPVAGGAADASPVLGRTGTWPGASGSS